MAQLTSDSLLDCDSIPDFIGTGTTMIFHLSNAPTSWTKVTTYDDQALRVVSGAADIGGNTAFSVVFSPQTQPTPGTTGGATLGSSQITAHTHDALAAGVPVGPASFPNRWPAVYRATASSIVNSGANTVNPYTLGDTLVVGVVGGGSHTHSISMTAENFNIAYVDIIFATKN